MMMPRGSSGAADRSFDQWLAQHKDEIMRPAEV
jgi:hypothetical protein